MTYLTHKVLKNMVIKDGVIRPMTDQEKADWNLRHQVPPSDESYPLKAQVPPDRKWPVGGYAPGSYTCLCNTCGARFIGDKRAYICADCTIQALRTPPREKAEELVEALDRMQERASEVINQWGDPFLPTAEWSVLVHQNVADLADAAKDARALLASLEPKP